MDKKNKLLKFGNPHLDKFEAIYAELEREAMLTEPLIAIATKVREFLASRRQKRHLQKEIEIMLLEAFQDLDLLFFTGNFAEKLFALNFFTPDQIGHFSAIIEKSYRQLERDVNEVHINTRSKVLHLISEIGLQEDLKKQLQKLEWLYSIMLSSNEDELVIGNAILAYAKLAKKVRGQKSKALSHLSIFSSRHPFVRDCIDRAIVELQDDQIIE